MSHGKIKAVFDTVCGHVKIDKALAARINEFQVGFLNKNEEHATFFGGNLTGVQVVRFTNTDKDKWFTDVLEIDELLLEEKLLEIDVIHADRHVSSDAFNHVCMWLIHKFMTDKTLPEKVRDQAMIDVGLVLYYRFLTSLLFRYFRYPADAQIAAATYAQLSYKFSIKQYGSWLATLTARSLDLSGEKSIHTKTFMQFDDDLKIVYLLNDSQGRIRDMMKNIYGEFMKIHKQGTRIKITSSVVEHDGEEILRDKTKNLSAYTRYLASIISDENSFIKQDLVDLVCKMMHTMPPKLFVQTLKWCSSNYQASNNRQVEELLTEVMVHSFGYLADNRTVLKETNDLSSLLTRLRGVYMSSRSTDAELIAIRDKAMTIARTATSSKNESVIASIRTGVMLYFTLRAFTMNYYSS